MMLAVSLVFGMLLIWSGVSGVLIVLLIYRATLSVRAEDQLFLDPGEVHLQREQQEVLRKLERLSPHLWGLFMAWLVVGLATFGLWVWQQLR